MKKLSDNILCLLMCSHIFFANTILKETQIAIELLLTLWFLTGLWNYKLNPYEILMGIIFIIISFISYSINQSTEFLLAFKVMGLAILSAIYFTNKNISPSILVYIFIIDSLLILYQNIVGPHLYSEFIIIYGRNFSEQTNSRPLGLFMNMHTSAYFIAIYMLFWGYRNLKSVLGFIILHLSTSFYSFSAYAFQVISWIVGIKILVFVSLILAFILIMNIPELTFLDLLSDSGLISWVRVIGIKVVINQFFNFDSYERVFTLYPVSYKIIIDNWNDSFGNELALFTLIQHAGLPLFILYIYYLKIHARKFTLFILFSLLHYGDITSPIFIFMLIAYEKILKNKKLEKYDNNLISTQKLLINNE